MEVEDYVPHRQDVPQPKGYGGAIGWSWDNAASIRDEARSDMTMMVEEENVRPFQPVVEPPPPRRSLFKARRQNEKAEQPTGFSFTMNEQQPIFSFTPRVERIPVPQTFEERCQLKIIDPSRYAQLLRQEAEDERLSADLFDASL